MYTKCDSCGKDSQDTISYEWKAGRKTNSKAETSNHYGYNYSSSTTKTTTYYTDIISIPTQICSECYKNKLKRLILYDVCILYSSAIVLTLPIWVSIFAHNSNYSWGLCLTLYAAIGLATGFGKFRNVLNSKKSKTGYRLDTLRPFATVKMKNLGRDTLWTQDRFKELKPL